MSQANTPAVAPTRPPPSPSTYLLPLASQSSANLILLSLALLLSSGVLIKTFHPKYRFRAVTPAGGSSKASKRRESVLKSIILAQEAVADSAAAAGASGSAADRGVGGGRSRSTSSVSRDGGRGRSSSSVASTSAAIVQGLTKLSSGALTHLASPASRQEPIASGSKSPSVAGTPSRDSSTHGVSFASTTKTDGSGKKGKSKKGKGVASAPSLAAPVGTPTSSPFGSPRRRPMKDASTSPHLPIPAFIDATIQTEVPFLSLSDTSSAPPYPPAFVPLPSSPPPAPSPTVSTVDADVQTSPSLLPHSLPRLLPFNLHASFQSTPPLAHAPPITAPLSPPSSHDLLQTPAPRSRKQARKASAATLVLAQPTNTVVGMPRPPESKNAEDEQGASTFPVTPSPASRRSGTSLSRTADSPEITSLALPLTNGGRQGIGLAANGSPQKGKGRQLREGGGGAYAPMGGANGRYGIPAPIPIPAGLREQRSDSTQSSSTAATTSSSYSNPSTSPYLAHPGLPPLAPMTPPDVVRRSLGSTSAQGRGSARLSKEEEEAYWRSRNGEPQWDSASRVVGLGVEVDRPHDAERGRTDAGRSWSEAAGGSGTGSRGTSPVSVELPLSSMEGAARGLLVSPGSYFPAQLPGLMMSPVTAPIPLPIAAPSGVQSMDQSWPPQLVPSGYTMVPFPLPSTPSSAHAPQAVHSSSTSSQSRPSSRQSSLSVPLSTQQQQQQQQHQQQQLLQQQQHQAYAYAQAHAQYQHAVALQYQAQQQHHQQQQQQHQRDQSDQSTPGRESASSYPSQNLQTPQMVLHGWTSHPSSPGVPPPSQYAVTQSPTSATFPPPIYAYYATSAAPNSYISGYHMPQTNHQGGRQSSGKMRDARKSPRMGMEKQRSFSGPTSATGPDLGAWKVRMRTAEMDADRAGKELEIARWRLAVLEEERIAGEVENQEALAALATRAMRAEARLKALEDARHQESSSTSGSGSPVTRPSSVMESTELPSDPLPPSIVSSDEPDSRFPSSPSIKVHPLAWLDLTTISLTTQSQSASSSPYLSSPGGSSRKGRGGRFSVGGNEKEGRQRRCNSNVRRRSTNSVAPADFELEDDDDDDEVVIVLDSPLRRKMPPRPASRRSSFLGDDDALDPEGSVGNIDDEELSTNGDFDDGENGERAEHVDYIGSLPTFLKTTHTAALAAFDSPRCEGRAPQELATVPSFVLDCGTPSPNEEKTSWSGSEREEERTNGQATTDGNTPTTSSLISMCA